MMGFGKRHDRPFPELLAAYADGELDAAARARVEAWLAGHPAARSALDAQRRLSRRNRKFWRASAAPNPGEANWARVFDQVQDALHTPLRPMPAALPRQRWRMHYLAPAVSAAAALVLYIAFSIEGSAPIGLPAPPAESEAFVMATDADIDIISMEDGDASAIVVGKRPLSGAVVLAAVGDVELRNVQKDSAGMMPKVQMNDVGLAPMIIAPVAGR
jgi:hypothetical protein